MPIDTESVPVTTHYLEMLDHTELRPKRVSTGSFQVLRVEEPCPELNHFLYCAVGWQWWWIDKLHWEFDDWNAYVNQPELETWVGYVSGTPAGYFELEREPGGDVKILYFGLLPQFTGRGLGGPLLTAAVERAWNIGAKRVWVHTCSLDHPAALSNYLARGFRVFNEETHVKIIPAVPQRNWP